MATQTKTTLPDATTSTFNADLQAFLRQEDADRYDDLFISHVVSGGTHSTGASLTQTPASLTAYCGGYYVTETGSITYPDDATHIYVIAHKDTTSAVTNWTRVTGTHYLFRTGTAAEPSLPDDSCWLMKVTTSSGSVTAVEDRRLRRPYPLHVSTSAPTSTDDDSKGFFVGFTWVDTSTDTIYQMADATTGAAVWDTVAGIASTLRDADGDTYIRTEQNADEDIIRFGVAGSEVGTWTSSLLTTTTPLTVGGEVKTTGIEDADGDTAVKVEESADEDIIRFDIAGTEVGNWTGDELTVTGVLYADNIPSAVQLVHQGSGVWVAVAPDGATIDISSSTTDGLQEAIDHAITNGWELIVHGGAASESGANPAVINCATGITFPAMASTKIRIEGAVINFTTAVTGTGIRFKTCMNCDVEIGNKIVYRGSGAAVEFKPEGTMETVTVITNSRFKFVTIDNIGQSGLAGGTGIKFDISAWSILQNYFEVLKIDNGKSGTTTGNGIQVTDAGASKVFQQNEIVVYDMRDANIGLEAGTSSGTGIRSNIFNLFFSVLLDSDPIAVDMWGSSNIIYLDQDSAATGSVGIKWESDAALNSAYVLRNDAVTKVTDSSTSGDNEVIESGKTFVRLDTSKFTSLAANNSTSSSSFVDADSDFDIAVKSGETWAFEYHIFGFVNGSTDTGKLALNGPTTSALKINAMALINDNTIASDFETAYDTDIDAFPTGAGVRTLCIITGRAVFTADGTLKLRFRSSGGTDTVSIFNGSTVSARKE